MRYPYYDASDKQFEDLVLEICYYLLGTGVHGFSTGPDEGRDARFDGTAERFPSTVEPYKGRFVIQAKHTEHPFAKFGDSDFSSTADSSVVSKEIPKIASLVEFEELDHYILFSNRRLAGKVDRRLRRRIQESTSAATVELFGVERIDQHLKHLPDAIDRAGLSELKSPLRVTPDDLAEIICALSENKQVFQAAASREIAPLERHSFEEKNAANNLGEGFAKKMIRDYARWFDIVDDFLGHPENFALLERYNDAVAEFQEQILVQASGHRLDQVLLNIQRQLWDRDADLARKKRHTKLMLYYMYWICDLGESPHA